MSAFAIGHILLVVVTLSVATAISGRAAGSLSALLVFCALYPRTITSFSGGPHAGISTSAPELATYSLVLLLCWLIVPKSRADYALLWIALITTPVFVFGFATDWPLASNTIAGALQYAIAPLALLVGLRAARGIDWSSPVNANRVVLTIALIVAAQAGISLLQLAGLDINPVSATASEWVGSRVNGTSNHPNTLGKQLVLLTVILLPLSRISSPRSRSLATFTIVVALVLIALTGGRANFIGALLAVALWAIFLPTKRSAARIATLTFLTIFAAAFASYFIERFQEDPTGGSRDRLTPVAFSLIRLAPILGHGPNNYVQAASNIDSYTSLTQLPVHNSVLLALAEVGVVGVAVLLGPVLILTLRAVPMIRREGAPSDFARGLVVLLPPVSLIALTGWGMVAGEILPLWMATVGLLWGAAVPRRALQSRRPTRAGVGSRWVRP